MHQITNICPKSNDWLIYVPTNQHSLMTSSWTFLGLDFVLTAAIILSKLEARDEWFWTKNSVNLFFCILILSPHPLILAQRRVGSPRIWAFFGVEHLSEPTQWIVSASELSIVFKRQGLFRWNCTADDFTEACSDHTKVSLTPKNSNNFGRTTKPWETPWSESWELLDGCNDRNTFTNLSMKRGLSTIILDNRCQQRLQFVANQKLAFSLIC